MLGRYPSLSPEEAEARLVKMGRGDGDAILRRVSEALSHSEALGERADMMGQVMRHHRGIGLAGIQVDFPYRILVMGMSANESKVPPRAALAFTVLINPRVLMREGREDGRENCLSIPDSHDIRIFRSQRVRVEFLDLMGERQEVLFEGWHARCFEHEEDHLNGRLIIDTPEPGIESMTSEELIRFMEQKKFPEGTRSAPVPILGTPQL